MKLVETFRQTLRNSSTGKSHTSAMSRPLWGILGGMGPLSSAEFVKTIYKLRAGTREQEAPPLILWSDPRVPDRTDFLLKGREDLLLEYLTKSLKSLITCGATDIVICCVTIHHIIDLLPLDIRARITSLVDVIYREVLARNQRYVMLCTNGTRMVQLFERHRLWNQVDGRIVLPSWDDQQRVHDLIYKVKHYGEQPEDVNLIEELTAKYEVDSFIAGCTEIHVLIREYGLSIGRDQSRLCLDPLMILGETICQLALSATATPDIT
jgi:aspartate racemase